VVARVNAPRQHCSDKNGEETMLSLLFGFNGRVRRLHYWLVPLGFLAVGLGLLVGAYFTVDLLFPLEFEGQVDIESPRKTAINIVGISALVLYILYEWSSIALIVKRWHDRDKSGFMFFILFIPLVGLIWTLIECGFLDGTQGPNKYGPSPKGIVGDQARVFD
jgi:uncharacterized membrane protein YhaH (DUF805 family)